MNLDIKNTSTTLFLLPIFKLNKDELKWFGLIDAYIGDVNHEQYDRSIYLLFRPTDLDVKFNDFITKFSKREDYIEDYDVDNGLVMVVLKFPDKFDEDYDLFLDGKYSKFSSEFKRVFPMTKDKFDKDGSLLAKEYTLYHHVFNKTDWLKNLWMKELGLESITDRFELWSKPDVEREKFDLKKLKIKKNE